MTARWVVDEVLPARDLSIVWQPISLLNKNQPSPDSDYYTRSRQSHNYLRVMEAVRQAVELATGATAATTAATVSANAQNGGSTLDDDPVFRFYWEVCRRIHHDGEVMFDVADALEAAGLDRSLAAAFDDERWDAEIQTRMDAGLELTGSDVGTPLIAMDAENGDRVGLFGPVITRVPDTETSLRLWDSFINLATIPGFWEIKRTRTERPEFGSRP